MTTKVCGHHKKHPERIYSPCIGCELERLQEDINVRNEVLESVGICTGCMKPPIHHINEPFSSCSCGTGEDTGKAPLQRLQILCAESGGKL